MKHRAANGQLPVHLDSSSGMILSHIGHIPKIGETITSGDFILEVIDMDGRRIDKVLVRRKAGMTLLPS